MWKELVLLGYLLMLSVEDIKNKTVQTVLLVIGMVATVVLGICGIGDGQNVMWYLLGSLPGAVLFLIAGITKKAGYADGVVLIIIGLFVGYYGCLIICGISLFMVSICAILLLAIKKVQKNSQLPYIPFLSGGYLLWYLFGGINV